MRQRSFLFVLVIACLIQSSWAQEFWETKDYKTWSAKECKKLQESSPWVQKHTISQVIIEQIGSSNNRAGESVGRDSLTKVEYVIQVRSAAPMRKAMARCQIIEAEKMPEPQRKTFEAQVTEFAETDYTDRIIVNVRFNTDNRLILQNTADFWRNQNVDKLKNRMFLITSKGRVSPTDFFLEPTQGREFEVHFPRTAANGEPLVASKEETFNFEFETPGIGASPSSQLQSRNQPSSTQGIAGVDANTAYSGLEHVLVQFKPQKMNVNGALAY